MSLEPEEKAAGRLFLARERGRLDRIVQDLGPHYAVQPYTAVYRHRCSARNHVSTALEVVEQYIPSPRITVETGDTGVVRAVFYDEWTPNDDHDLWQVPAGRFAFSYRQGRCARCKRWAISPFGNLVDAWQRPPIHGRVARR